MSGVAAATSPSARKGARAASLRIGRFGFGETKKPNPFFEIRFRAKRKGRIAGGIAPGDPALRAWDHASPDSGEGSRKPNEMQPASVFGAGCRAAWPAFAPAPRPGRPSSWSRAGRRRVLAPAWPCSRSAAVGSWLRFSVDRALVAYDRNDDSAMAVHQFATVLRRPVWCSWCAHE